MLCLKRSGSTIFTFQDILENGIGTYQEYVDALGPSARRFFTTQFNERQFAQTRQEIGRRLYGIIAIPTFERIFGQAKTKLDLFAEMNQGKIILINTARNTLKSHCATFGRFWLSLITMAAERRATLKPQAKIPCYLFIDELNDYIDNESDANLNIIVERCRKQKIALTVANRHLKELSDRTIATLQTSAIKSAAPSPEDMERMAKAMSCNSYDFRNLPRGTFLTYVRTLTPSAIPIQVPFGVLKKMERMSDVEYDTLIASMRARYASGATGERKDMQEADNTTAAEIHTTHQPPQEETADAVNIVHDTDASTTAIQQPNQPDEPKQTIVSARKRKPKKADKDNIDTSASRQW
jgi:hypothetical protein